MLLLIFVKSQGKKIKGTYTKIKLLIEMNYVKLSKFHNKIKEEKKCKHAFKCIFRKKISHKISTIIKKKEFLSNFFHKKKYSMHNTQINKNSAEN